MQRHEHPFLHFTVENFLPESELTRLTSMYNQTQFTHKYTDLFSLYQSEEQSQNTNLNFFFSHLDSFFSNLSPLNYRWYNCFFSYYSKSDYLLCHDDQVDCRKYAFTFYLDDYESGELFLYTKDFKSKKTVNVKKNLMVIFEVSEFSYHEVNFCKENGRRAVSGWFNLPDIKFNTAQLSYICKPMPFDAEINVPFNNFTHLPQYLYEYTIKSSFENCNYLNRRLLSLELEDPLIIKLVGYSLIDVSFYQVRKFDYLLVNDPINTLEDVVDMLFFVGTCDREIVYVKKSGKEKLRIKVEDGCWIVNRKKMKMFIHNGVEEFFLAHFIYKKEVKDD